MNSLASRAHISYFILDELFAAGLSAASVTAATPAAGDAVGRAGDNSATGEVHALPFLLWCLALHLAFFVLLRYQHPRLAPTRCCHWTWY